MAATSEARVSSTLTLTRSRISAPASASTRLMLTATLANCASKPSGSAPLASKPGMPETNRRSPARVAKDSGGALTCGGGAKSWIGMDHLGGTAGSASVAAGRGGPHKKNQKKPHPRKEPAGKNYC